MLLMVRYFSAFITLHFYEGTLVAAHRKPTKWHMIRTRAQQLFARRAQAEPDDQDDDLKQAITYVLENGRADTRKLLFGLIRLAQRYGYDEVRSYYRWLPEDEVQARRQLAGLIHNRIADLHGAISRGAIAEFEELRRFFAERTLINNPTVFTHLFVETRDRYADIGIELPPPHWSTLAKQFLRNMPSSRSEESLVMLRRVRDTVHWSR